MIAAVIGQSGRGLGNRVVLFGHDLVGGSWRALSRVCSRRRVLGGGQQPRDAAFRCQPRCELGGGRSIRRKRRDECGRHRRRLRHRREQRLSRCGHWRRRRHRNRRRVGHSWRIRHQWRRSWWRSERRSRGNTGQRRLGRQRWQSRKQRYQWIVGKQRHGGQRRNDGQGWNVRRQRSVGYRRHRRSRSMRLVLQRLRLPKQPVHHVLRPERQGRRLLERQVHLFLNSLSRQPC
jgi:hypothetical protein